MLKKTFFTLVLMISLWIPREASAVSTPYWSAFYRSMFLSSFSLAINYLIAGPATKLPDNDPLVDDIRFDAAGIKVFLSIFMGLNLLWILIMPLTAISDHWSFLLNFSPIAPMFAFFSALLWHWDMGAFVWQNPKALASLDENLSTTRLLMMTTFLSIPVTLFSRYLLKSFRTSPI